jgi:hypothetical protein
MPVARALAPALAGLLLLPAAGAAQVYRDLEPVDLVYLIYLNGEEVGTARISFHPTVEDRGPRLDVEAIREYVLPLTTPFEYSETVNLVCNEDGVRSFTAEVSSGETRTKHVGLLSGEDFHVTSTYQDRQEQKTITSGVRRTNFGLYCGGFLEESLTAGGLIQDWPWLVPSQGDHQPRQKVREAMLTRDFDGRPVPIVMSTLRRLDKMSDRMVNTAEGHQILLELEETIPYGKLTQVLESVNGKPPAESELIR